MIGIGPEMPVVATIVWPYGHWADVNEARDLVNESWEEDGADRGSEWVSRSTKMYADLLKADRSWEIEDVWHKTMLKDGAMTMMTDRIAGFIPKEKSRIYLDRVYYMGSKLINKSDPILMSNVAPKL